jgi:hypothetical protein
MMYLFTFDRALQKPIVLTPKSGRPPPILADVGSWIRDIKSSHRP